MLVVTIARLFSGGMHTLCRFNPITSHLSIVDPVAVLRNSSSLMQCVHVLTPLLHGIGCILTYMMSGRRVIRAGGAGAGWSM